MQERYADLSKNRFGPSKQHAIYLLITKFSIEITMYYPAIDLSGRLILHCRKLGYKLKFSNDFQLMKQYAHAMGYPVTPHFDPDKSDLFKSQCFWLGAYKKNSCVGMVACKRQELGKETLDQFVRRTWSRYYASDDYDDHQLSKNQQRKIRQVKGNLVYNGEFRIAEAHRSRGLGFGLWGVAKIVAFTKWPDTDWSYLFAKEWDWMDGFLAASHVPRQIRRGLNWEVPPNQEVSLYVVGLMDQEDFRDWVDVQLRDKTWSSRKD